MSCQLDPVRHYNLPISNDLWQQFDHPDIGPASAGATFFIFNAHFDLRDVGRPMARVFMIAKGGGMKELRRGKIRL